MPTAGTTYTLEETPTPEPAAGLRRPIRPLRKAVDATLRHRPDIDGLRAMAILLVVGYHAKLPGFSAGFIGVDVFFVLSGFLITRLILEEVDSTGTLRLGRFWIRRGRRLLPASCLMITSVLIASPWLGTPLRWKATLTEALAALTYWSNHLFANRATDYFGDAINVSPLLHTWSLAVEEQFYVLWPVLFFLVARFAGSGSPRAAAIRAGAVVCVIGCSLGLSLQLTTPAGPLAFFYAISRAWEFGVGALLAIAVLHLGSIPPTVRRILGPAGAVLLVTALVTITDRTAFPGTAALLPVLATAALIAAEFPSHRGFGRVLAARPVQVVGQLSYSWYLWHWPFVIFGVAWLGHDTVLIRLALSAAALVPAQLTRRLVENPVRRSAALARSTRRSVALLLTITLSGIGLAGVLWWHADRTLEDPLLATLVSARSDRGDVYGPCASTSAETILTHCAGGDPSGSGRILVLGDSHGSHWIPAVDVAAKELGMQMTASVLGNCPSIDVQWDRQRQYCSKRQSALPGLIDAVDPDVVVMSHSVGYLGSIVRANGAPVSPDGQFDAWRQAMTDFAHHLHQRGTALVVVLDTPRFEEDPIDCMARTRTSSGCDVAAAAMHSLLDPFHQVEQAALAAAGYGTTYDPLPHLCDTRCPVVIDGEIVYNDEHHLTGTFSRSFAADLAGTVDAARLRDQEAGS